MGTSMKMTVVWVVVLHGLVEVNRYVRGTIFFLDQGYHPIDGGTKHLWNVGELLPDYLV
jgi:hypothetical protein